MRQTFRLAGYGGAALFVGCQAASAGTLKAEQPGLAFDIGLLSPDRHVSYLNRRATPDFIPRLSQYLFDAAAQFHPEQTLPAFTDHAVPLMVSVRSSAADRVELEVSVMQDADDELADADTLIFETSRVALTSSARTLPRLTGSTEGPNLDMEF